MMDLDMMLSIFLFFVILTVSVGFYIGRKSNNKHKTA